MCMGEQVPRVWTMPWEGAGKAKTPAPWPDPWVLNDPSYSERELGDSKEVELQVFLAFPYTCVPRPSTEHPNSIPQLLEPETQELPHSPLQGRPWGCFRHTQGLPLQVGGQNGGGKTQDHESHTEAWTEHCSEMS